MKNIGDMAKSILIQKSPKNLSKEQCRIPSSLLFHMSPVEPSTVDWALTWPALQEADLQVLHPHDSSRVQKASKVYSFFLN